MIKKWKFIGSTITTFETIERVFEVDMDAQKDRGLVVTTCGHVFDKEVPDTDGCFLVLRKPNGRRLMQDVWMDDVNV